MNLALKRDPLLMLAPIMPSDRGNGLAMRAGFFLDAYSRHFDVDVFVVPVAGSMPPSAFACARSRRLEVLSLDRPDSHYGLVAALHDPSARLEAFRRYGRPSFTAFIGPASRSLAAMVGDARYALVHVSRLYLAELALPWIAGGRARAVLDCDESETEAYRRFAVLERRRGRLLAAAWADAEAEAFGRFSLGWLPRFDLVFAASRDETSTLAKFGARTVLVPNVVEVPPPRQRRPTRRPFTILFVGTFGYAPNVEAAIWFVSRVWRRLQRAMHNRVRLLIVGSNPPPVLTRLGSQRGIVVTGTVPNIARYYREADIVIAPVHFGGGTRIKVLEAAAHGVPMIATKFAIAGTTFHDKADMLLADNEISFLRACLALAKDAELCRRLSTQARARTRREYLAADWSLRVGRLASNLLTGSPGFASEFAVGESIDVRGLSSGGQS